MEVNNRVRRVSVVFPSVPLYQCVVCKRFYPTREAALRCRLFSEERDGWFCRPPRGSDRW